MTETKENNLQLVRKDCQDTLDAWVGGCQLDCDECPTGARSSDICYLLYWFFGDVIENTDMEVKLGYLRARSTKKRKMPSLRATKEFYAVCTNLNCKYSETVSLEDGKLVATKKFMQGSDGEVYHICSDERPSKCKLR